MTTELSTNLVQINFKEIIDNSLNRRYWEKIWHIFAYDNVVVTVNLYDIEIENNKVGLIVRTTNYNLDHYDKSASAHISLPIDRYHQEVFQNNLLGAVHRSLITLERRAAYMSDEYDELVEIARDKENDARNELIAFLDDEGITSEAVREAYLEQNDPYFRDEVEDYVNSFENNHLQHVHNMVDILIQFEAPEEESTDDH